MKEKSNNTVGYAKTDIKQVFYDNMASQYDKLFLDWKAATHEQAEILNVIFENSGFNHHARFLDSREQRAKRACIHIWRQPQGSHTPLLAAGLLTFMDMR